MRPVLLLVIVLCLAAGCATKRAAVEPVEDGVATEPVDRGVMAPRAGVATGLASYYASHFDGRRTASGTRFDNTALVAAHPTLPFGSIVRVTNLKNGRHVTVRIVDRGPTLPNRRDGVIIDLSRHAADRLGILRDGRAPVRIEVLR